MLYFLKKHELRKENYIYNNFDLNNVLIKLHKKGILLGLFFYISGVC